MESITNYLADYIPNEIKAEIYKECDYLTKISYYQLLKNDSNLNGSIHKIRCPGTRHLNSKEIKYLIKLDNELLLRMIFEIPSEVFYISDYIDKSKRVYLLYLSIKFQSRNIFDYLLGSNEPPKDNIWLDKLCYKALSVGNLYFFERLVKLGYPVNSDVFLGLAKSNDLELFHKFKTMDLNLSEPLNLGPKSKMSLLVNINPRIDLEEVDERLLRDKYFVNTCHIKKHIDDIYTAVSENGNINFLDYLYEISPPSKPILLSTSLLKGKTNVVEWAIKKMIPMSPNHCSMAAQSGSLETLIWMRDKGCPWDKDVIYKACQSGNIKIFEYIYHEWTSQYKGLIFPTDSRLIEHAAKGNSMEMVRHLYINQFPGSEKVLYYACKYDNYEMFKYGIDNLFSDIRYIPRLGKARKDWIEKCIKNNQISYLKYAFDSGCLDCTEVCEYSCTYGHLEMVEYISKHIDVYLSKHISIAAYHKNYEIVMWSISNKMDIYERTTGFILQYRNNKLMDYLLSIGYIPTKYDYTSAIVGDNLEFYIKLNMFTHADITTAVESGAIEILKHIHKHIYNVCSYSTNLPSLARKNNQEKVLQWLKDIGFPDMEISDKGLIFNLVSTLYEGFAINK